MRTILYFISRMLPFMAISLPIYALLRYLYLKLRHIKTINYRHEYALLVFVVFIMGLASITILPKELISFCGMKCVTNGTHTTNLKLFNVFADLNINNIDKHTIHTFIIDIVGNIAMFMPFGFFPALLYEHFSWKKALLLGASCSLFIELCQLFLPRDTDVDDIWLNTLGAVIGYLLYKLFEKHYPEKSRQYK